MSKSVYEFIWWTNIKFFEDPRRSGEKLFLLFGHNHKNIFNYFLSKEQMHVPTAGFEQILGEACTAFFCISSASWLWKEVKLRKLDIN